jgi:hypothetical protein
MFCYYGYYYYYYYYYFLILYSLNPSWVRIDTITRLPRKYPIKLPVTSKYGIFLSCILITGRIVALTLWRLKRVNVFFYPFLRDFLKNIAYWKVSRLCRCVFWYKQHVDKDECGSLLLLLLLLLFVKHKRIVFIRHCCMFLLLTSAYNREQTKIVVVTN